MSVLADVDLVPRDDGVLVPGARQHAGVLVGWPELAEALGGQDPLSPAAQCRVSDLLRLYQVVAERGEAAAADLIRNAARALALPPGHTLHPGPGWVRDRLRGGALELGVGVLGPAGHADDVRPLPPSVAGRLDLAPVDWWPDLRDHAERMGELAAGRIARDGRAVLRPVGGCDALTLLASAALRDRLAGGDRSGLRAVALPTRHRGWFDLAQIDPAYAAAVWSITAEPDRGLPAPVLVTRDEVVLPRPGGDVIATSLGRGA